MQIVRTAIVFLFAAVLGAQTFRGSITGVVTDSSGAAIAGAAVGLSSPTTGLTRAVVTNSQGQYLFPDLAVGLTQSPSHSPASNPVRSTASRSLSPGPPISTCNWASPSSSR